MQWKTINPESVWPDVLSRADGERHDYRIFFDPCGENVTFPGHAPGDSWWASVIREVRSDGSYCHVRYSVHRSLTAAQRDAEQWESNERS